MASQRNLTAAEINALSAYLPEDLTPEQLEAVLAAAVSAVREAHDAGYSAGQAITTMRYRTQQDAIRRQEADALDADDRIKAWNTITDHPLLAPAFDMDGPLIQNMLRILDQLHPHGPRGPQGPTQ